MSNAEESYRAFAARRGLAPIEGFWPGPVTPLLAKGGDLDPALRGSLLDGVEGVIARDRYTRSASASRASTTSGCGRPGSAARAPWSAHAAAR